MVAILLFPGTNCQTDMLHVYEDILHVKSIIVWHKETSLPKQTQLVVIPGGFSYGDHLRSGAIARFAPVMQSLRTYANNGGVVLGICNGFQILTEAGMLPGVLRKNIKGKFISKIEKLKIVDVNNKLLSAYKKGDIISMPIAHGDGNYYADENTLQSLKENNQILLKYVDNPNGSLESIAGICNKERNIFGLMPHPERFVEKILGGIDGLAMLKSLL